MAKPAAPTAALGVVPRWTYQDGGKLAVIAGCSQRGERAAACSWRSPVRQNRENTQLPCAARTSTISPTLST